MKPSSKTKSKVIFWKKFLRLTRGRVVVVRALEVIEQEERNQQFAKVIHSVRTSLEKGSTLAEAMAAYPGEFSLSVIELVKTAEKTGAWDEILAEIAGGLEDGTFD